MLLQQRRPRHHGLPDPGTGNLGQQLGTLGEEVHISGLAYAVEMAWREDGRRLPNGVLHQAATAAALAHPVSRQWKGYWQRKAG